MSLFTSWKPDPIGVMLGTGFMRYESGEAMCGLARIQGECLEVLAVYTDVEGCGNFRNFISRAKKEFKEIHFHEVWNPIVARALTRYGFRQNNNLVWTWRLKQNYARIQK